MTAQLGSSDHAVAKRWVFFQAETWVFFKTTSTLVGQGLTNRQIAARLVITERTAGAHIEHILDKLGFTSRTQIGVWVAGNVPAGSVPH